MQSRVNKQASWTWKKTDYGYDVCAQASVAVCISALLCSLMFIANLLHWSADNDNNATRYIEHQLAKS